MTRGENDFAHVRFSLRKEMSREIFVKGRRHWVPEDGSHGCFITERGGSGAGATFRMVKKRVRHLLCVSWGPKSLLHVIFFSQYCMGVLLLFPVSLLFFIFCPPLHLPLFVSFYIHVCGWNGTFSQCIHFSRSSWRTKTQREKNIIRPASRNRPRLHLV